MTDQEMADNNSNPNKWNYCERIRNGKRCCNLTRRMKGKTCTTCFSAQYRERHKEYDTLCRAVRYYRNAEKIKADMKAKYWADPVKARLDKKLCRDRKKANNAV